MSDAPRQPTVHPRRHRRWAVRAALGLFLLLAGLELLARFGLGLGDPPLVQKDPQIEYLFQPSKSYTRFGNRIAFNQWSMRSDDFPIRKADAQELRIMVLGDSVVNGGAQTDQPDIATEIIRRELAAKLNRPVVVGNISAGSWGPANLLAYVQRFGWFDADIVVMVLSSHDAADAPTFAPLGADSPEHKPILALQEAAQRYLPRYLPGWLGGIAPEAPRTPQQIEADTKSSLAALRELIGLSQSAGTAILIVQHEERSELEGTAQAGHTQIAALAAESQLPALDDGQAFAASLARGADPYRDNIHPNQTGQRILADVIEAWILGHPPASPP